MRKLLLLLVFFSSCIDSVDIVSPKKKKETKQQSTYNAEWLLVQGPGSMYFYILTVDSVQYIVLSDQSGVAITPKLKSSK